MPDTMITKKKKKAHINDLGKDPVPELVLRLALPTMLAQLVSVLYSVVDRMYIGIVLLWHPCGPGRISFNGYAYGRGEYKRSKKDHE